uniref:Uncharacterized protein n=1 Tax=Meloidogyne enterolobii TaxID=390850 RepID=A0A6V7VZK5_MELEN|nr:unnamed protein product [Meloidogyne enterolobii]
MLEEVNNPNQTKEERELRWDEYVKIRRSFQTITNENDYNTFVEKDNHLMLVQRMLGSKIGTGGSSGYMYLR